MGDHRNGSLQVQVVLYKTELAQIWRLTRGVAAAVRHSTSESGISANLALGDSSPSPLLETQDVRDLTGTALETGLDGFGYTFFDANLGSSGGSNRLAGLSDAELILILNPDTYPAPNMLSRLLSAMDDPSVGVAEARQIPLEHPKESHPANGDTSWASGCCMLVRRSVFESVEGFDFEHFPLYCDDVDFSWRVRLAGFRVVHVPRAVVFHDKRIELSGGPVPAPTELYHGTLGRLMLATRYGRPDLVEETIERISRSGEPAQREALADFTARRDERRLPGSIEGADRVAQFFGGEYARHRF